VVDGCLQERAVAEDLREESELERGAPQLTLQSVDTKVGLLGSEWHQVVRHRIKPGRQVLQPVRPVRGAGTDEHASGFRRGTDQSVELF
jgi:hypothetical protein